MLGWRLDADLAIDDSYRVVQLTPPGSACSIIFGVVLTSAQPGSFEGLQLTVNDIDHARGDLIARGVDVSATFHDMTGVFHHAGTQGRVNGAALNMRRTGRSPPSAILTGTDGCSKRYGHAYLVDERRD